MHMVSFKLTLPGSPDRSGLALILGDPDITLSDWQAEVNERADALGVPPAQLTFTSCDPTLIEEVELARECGITVHQFAERTYEQVAPIKAAIKEASRKAAEVWRRRAAEAAAPVDLAPAAT